MADKVEKVMGEFKRGELHSGSKKGPVVESEKQAKAIALSEARKAGQKVSPKKGQPRRGSHTYKRGSVRVDTYQS